MRNWGAPPEEEVVALTWVSAAAQGRDYRELVASRLQGSLARGKIVLECAARAAPWSHWTSVLNAFSIK